VENILKPSKSEYFSVEKLPAELLALFRKLLQEPADSEPFKQPNSVRGILEDPSAAPNSRYEHY